jgi:hypothetical protein
MRIAVIFSGFPHVADKLICSAEIIHLYTANLEVPGQIVDSIHNQSARASPTQLEPRDVE